MIDLKDINMGNANMGDILALAKKMLIDIYDPIIHSINSSNMEQITSTVKIIVAVICIILLGVIIRLAIHIRKNTKRHKAAHKAAAAARTPQPKVMSGQWAAVLKKVDGEDAELYKLAVLEADKIFDDLLKRMKISGEDMGERLKQLKPGQVPDLDGLWRAHKLRNRVAHEPDFRLSRAEAKMAVETYRGAMEKMGALGK